MSRDSKKKKAAAGGAGSVLEAADRRLQKGASPPLNTPTHNHSFPFFHLPIPRLMGALFDAPTQQRERPSSPTNRSSHHHLAPSHSV